MFALGLQVICVHKFAVLRVNFVHRFYFLPHFLHIPAQHFLFFLHGSFLLEVFLQVVGDRHRVLPVLLGDEVPKDFLFADNALSERVELGVTVRDALRGRLGSADEVLAVRQVAAHLFADHHAEFVDAQFGAGSVVPPVVVVGPANGIKLVWVFVLDRFFPLLLRHLVPELVGLRGCLALHVFLPVLFSHLIN